MMSMDMHSFSATLLWVCSVLQATADSVPLQAPGTASAPTAKGSSDAVYIKAPIAAGATLEHPDSSVVVLGDVPQSARIRAGGDIIIMGT
jgi:septum formation inhibitor MinC